MRGESTIMACVGSEMAGSRAGLPVPCEASSSDPLLVCVYEGLCDEA